MSHSNDITDTEDNGNKLQSDGDVPVPKEKFLFREPIVLISIVCLSLLNALSMHLLFKNVAMQSREFFTIHVYSLSVSTVPMIGSIFASFLSEFIGRKHVYRYLYAISVFLFILVVSSRHPTVMSMVFILRGMIKGGNLAMNTVSISEYSSPKHRLTWMIFDKTAYLIISRAMSKVALDTTAFYVLLISQIMLGLICLGSTWAWPESPYWLANKGKLQQSRAAFMWLRGKGGREELASVLKARRRPGPPKLFWISLFIALATISITIFSFILEIELTMYYRDLTSETYGSQFYSNLFGTVAISCALATASYFIRRKLLFIVVSIISFSLCYVEILCSYLFDNIHGGLFSLLNIASDVMRTSGPLAFGAVLFVEITPHKYNTIISCICFTVMIFCLSSGFPLVRHFIYPPFQVSAFMVLSTTLALVATLLYYFFAPETKDKTLLEIQRSYIPDENDSNTKQNEAITLNVVETLDQLIE